MHNKPSALTSSGYARRGLEATAIDRLRLLGSVQIGSGPFGSRRKRSGAIRHSLEGSRHLTSITLPTCDCTPGTSSIGGGHWGVLLYQPSGRIFVNHRVLRPPRPSPTLRSD